MVKFHTLSVAAILAIASSNTIFASVQNAYEYDSQLLDDSTSFVEKNSRSFSSKPKAADTASHATKDYVIAVENSSQFTADFWNKDLREFLDSLIKKLASSSGRKTISLVDYSTIINRWLTRETVKSDQLPQADKKLDMLLKNRRNVANANVGYAVKYLRRNFYANGAKYLVNDYSTELTYDAAPGKDTVIFIITSGEDSNPDFALKESLNDRRNGATYYVIDFGGKNGKFWGQFVGCRYHYSCPNYIVSKSSNTSKVLDHIATQLSKKGPRDAVCYEEWSDYSECSKPCGTGIKTAVLEGFKTLVAPSSDSTSVGRSCKEQMQNYKTKQLLCNMQPCNKATETDIRAHTNDGETTTTNKGVMVRPFVMQPLKFKGSFDLSDEGSSVDPENDKSSVSQEEVEKMRENDVVDGKPRHYVPSLYDGNINLDEMLQFATDANRYMSKCNTKSKDYVIALEDTTQHSEKTWKDLQMFVRLLADALSATNGTNTLSLVNFSSKNYLTMDKTILSPNNMKEVDAKIGKMFEKRSKDKEADLGSALRFLRNNVYINGNKYLLKDARTELLYKDAPGKDTVVFIITCGNIVDRNVALQEAFDARRNGVTFYVIDVEPKMQQLWTQMIGCRYHFSCPNYVVAKNLKPTIDVEYIMEHICTQPGKDAVCAEDWSPFSECSVKCGGGVRTSVLQGYRTLLTHSVDRGSVGKSCQEQLKDVKAKQLLCNMRSCKPHELEQKGPIIESSVDGPTKETSVNEPANEEASDKSAGAPSEDKSAESTSATEPAKDETVTNEHVETPAGTVESTESTSEEPTPVAEDVAQPPQEEVVPSENPTSLDNEEVKEVESTPSNDGNGSDVTEEEPKVTDVPEAAPLEPAPTKNPEEIAVEPKNETEGSEDKGAKSELPLPEADLRSESNQPSTGSVEKGEPQAEASSSDNYDTVTIPEELKENLPKPEIETPSHEVAPTVDEHQNVHVVEETSNNDYEQRAHREDYTTNDHSDEHDKESYFTTTNAMMGSAVCVVVCAIVGGGYALTSKKDTSLDGINDGETPFFDDSTNGREETADTYDVAGANDNLWA
ncbi:Thrombospondin-Related Anonymous Protein 3 (TRAP3) [Babesia bovis T2Bo]|uniref:VWFA domain-containing protein n=1 Tax=Babesia bovis TaxID=5865 RepID=A7ATF7_BABBO|nr:Thrombospondin-Related Anonymous Protein 3 (TRAP3) [Babesia bovis T2Bo]EDO06218.1 Thrombospondin-Related Anonymous Protein 3 (TRAP3) [Babesia bovis T2Bo]|eukprot:XP_001609786.1 hypothetical protein [Babesia bovis T2Bo]